MKPAKIVAIGTKHGKLTVIKRGSKGDCHTYRYWFQCDCGAQFEAFPWHTIKIGHCGCLTPTAEERLVRMLALNENTSCWEFLGNLNNNGYGHIAYFGKLIYAHRLAWLLWRGEIPKGICVLHKCDNGKCCNPDHLWLGTVADNNADCLRKGRHISGFTINRGIHKPMPGESNPFHKLTERDVLYARAAYWRNVPIATVARCLEVSETTIADAVKGKTWKHVAWST